MTPSRDRVYPRLFLVIFLPFVLALGYANRVALLDYAWYEEGDDAANALQIHKAKELRELHGNYSRFNFNHPGPGFFYAYAAGEILLYDQLKLVPTARNAHLIVTLILQAGFFAAALALAARASPQPLWVAAAGLALAALHFGHIYGPFFNNWPPFVLLMPFLCLLVSAAATSIGRGQGLFTLVLTGCLLIHGHVAQPLFVGPIVGVAVTAMIRNRRAAQRPWITRHDAPTVAVAALAVLPLFLDIFAGRQSNAFRVLSHFTHQSDAGQSIYQALLCFLSYFVYTGDQAIFNQVRPESFVDFDARGGLLLLWALILAGAAGVAWKVRQRDDAGRFTWRLLGFFALGAVLTLIWGMRQDSGFTNFNSFFNFGLIFTLPLILVTGVSLCLPRSRWLAGAGGVACAGALLLAGQHLRLRDDPMGRGRIIQDALPKILAADPRKDAVKVLEFGYVDGDWYESATLARALQRAHISVYVTPAWRVMFGEDLVFTNQDHVLEKNRFSRWQIVRRDRFPDTVPLTQEFGVRISAAGALGPLPARISFAGDGNHEQFAQYGFGRSAPNTEWVWTDARVAALDFSAEDRKAPVTIALDVAAYRNKRAPTSQSVRVHFNGDLVGSWSVGERTRLQFTVSAERWNRQKVKRLVLELPDAYMPARIFGSGERRELSLSVYAVEFSEDSTP